MKKVFSQSLICVIIIYSYRGEKMIYAIGDLHLDSTDLKPMSIFGGNWQDHDKKIKASWLENVKEDDLVLLPGDTSWAMRFS